MGTPFQLGMPTEFMFNFLTRLECFNHAEKVFADKPALLITVGCKPDEIQAEDGTPRFKKMVDHGDLIRSMGYIYFNSQSPPCLTCGAGSYCRKGGLWVYILGKGEKKLEDFEFTSDKFHQWEDCPHIVEEVNRYSRMLGDL